MIHPRIDELLENVDSRYALVIVAAKRARQINNYHHQLGEAPSTSSCHRWSSRAPRTT
jgi:DNA-directed RNA polymerase omega subunit